MPTQPLNAHKGPLSESEAKYLWKNGRTEFGKGNYPDAARALRRLIDRYPAREGFLDAHLMLGLVYLRLHKPAEAISPLKYYVASKGHSTEGLRARLRLGRAFYLTRKHHEGLLLTREILDHSPPEEVFLEALLLRAWTLIGLNKDLKAQSSLSSFRENLRKRKSTGHTLLRSQAARLDVEIKLRECNRWIDGKPLNEGAVRERTSARGHCLKEALVLFYKEIQEHDDLWTLEARSSFGNAYRLFQRDCRAPPPPVGKRTTLEKKRYREELADVLVTDCQKTRNEALDLIAHWKEKISKSVVYHLDHMEKLIRSL